MEVILNQDVDKLGKRGAVVKVKEGFARNFLIPNHLAVPVTPANLKKLQQEKERQEQLSEKFKKESQELNERLSGISLTIPALTQEDDKLFGSITRDDIASALKDEGIGIDKNAILLEENIKALGIYEVPVKLHQEIMSKVKVWVVRK
ncbi:MAG: 50S ribosomal protein L9 [Candidatus Omnitrophota bacterium]